jgi:integrase
VLATVKWRSFYRTLKIYFDGGKIPLSAELSPANMDVVRASVVLRQGYRWVRSHLAENSTPLWSHHSIPRRDETWLPEWSGKLGGVERCDGLGISGVSLHSYRYAWSERALKCGFPERFAQQALGHNSKAVHRAYAKHAEVTVPSLADWEKEWEKNSQRNAQPKLLPVDFRSTPSASSQRN